jgi:hypothetical protein
MSGCVGIGPSALFFLGARDAVKAALLLLLLYKWFQDGGMSKTDLSYIPQMLMLKIYRPRWTQCDDNALHDPLGLVIVR